MPNMFSEEKLKNLVLYICDRVSDPAKLGSTKLNKILYYSDFVSYSETGEPITGEKYIKNHHGPTAHDILKIEDELEQEDKLATRKETYHSYQQKQYFAKTKPDLSPFSAEEISIVDKVIDTIANDHSATSISLASHTHVWKSADFEEEIPYETAFVNQLGEINKEDVQWANEIIEKREREKSA